MPAFLSIDRIGKALLAFAIGLFFLSLYLNVAQQQSPVNPDLTRSDQGAYMDIAKQAYETRFQYTGTRNQMPLYPWIQALFYSPEMDDETFFQQGKRLNIALSLICLLTLGIAFFAKFSKIYAFYSILFIAFLVFAIKSPFFQTEILFYTLFSFAFILSLDTLISPKWYKPIGVGLLFALAHLSKSSGMPGLFIFASSYGILFLLKLFSRGLSREQVRQILYYALAPVAVFMILLLPYFQESKEKYGSYFYNVNSSRLMWYDSWDEAFNAMQRAEEQGGWASLPAEEIPSLSNYLKDHSPSDMIARFRLGAKHLIWSGCNYQLSPYAFGHCGQVVLSLIIFVVCLPLLFKGSQFQNNHKNMHIVWYILLFFILYGLSFLWFIPISGRGPRTIFTLMIPLLWIIGFTVHSPQIQSLQFKLLRPYVKAVDIIYLLMTLTLFHEIYQIITIRAAILYGGK